MYKYATEEERLEAKKFSKRKYKRKMQKLGKWITPEQKRLKTKKWRENNKEKEKSHAKVYWALKSGKLIKPDKCSCCKLTKQLVAHHDDYDKPLDVKWLCQHCHNEFHGKKRNDKIIKLFPNGRKEKIFIN